MSENMAEIQRRQVAARQWAEQYATRRANRGEAALLDLDLVHVVWGSDDQGVVSLKEDKIVFYTFGDFNGHHSFVPTVEIDDADFGILVAGKPAEQEDEALAQEANWDNVCRLLKHPAFPLHERIELPHGEAPRLARKHESALAVLVLTPHIGDYLAANDPKALTQAQQALDGSSWENLVGQHP